MRVLGIETSCDETGVAIYDSEKGLLGHLLHSQIEEHREYGGVVPELASRDHIRKTLPLVDELLKKTGLCFQDIHGIAYTAGPGLVGALLVGAMIGRSLAYAWNIPSVPIHHMEGHLLACMLESPAPSFPFIGLLVSGGHTQLIRANGVGSYEILGDTLDDAVGEAFDKTAKLLGLGYPGGAALASLAEKGVAKRFHFPRPMLDRPGLDFSFSGLKTAAATLIAGHTLDDQTRADIACAFQEAVIETLVVKCQRAMRSTGLTSLVVAGGVGANQLLRHSLKNVLGKEKISVFFPRQEFCTDNGAMIAYAGYLRLQQSLSSSDLAVRVFPRWSLDNL